MKPNVSCIICDDHASFNPLTLKCLYWTIPYQWHAIVLPPSGASVATDGSHPSLDPPFILQKWMPGDLSILDVVDLHWMRFCPGAMGVVQHINSLWPSDAIWQQWSESTLAQVMACCLMAPSHYLNQCWLIISKVQRHSSEGNFIRDTSATIHSS